ncbi:MAG: NUDIX domain-containing protein [Campylobacterota bacterium]|nr:NUDIX domain-containing protein [Campylobacterota bacterium]
MDNIKAYGICLYKIEKNNIKVLLCKSVSSKDKWGFLKGVEERNETKEQTAIREFHEECGIKVEKKYLENYFEQKNETKDIGIYLVNYDNINNIEDFFVEEKLLSNYLSWENSSVKFFNTVKLPLIKTKQTKLIIDILKFLKGL